MTSIHNLKRTQVLQAFARLGWQVARDEGRHTVPKHGKRPGTLSVPRHRVIAPGTMRELLKDPRLTWEEFLAAYS